MRETERHKADDSLAVHLQKLTILVNREPFFSLWFVDESRREMVGPPGQRAFFA
jgi:hypothetical protein